jgi:small subunit ribosomal protein S1
MARPGEIRRRSREQNLPSEDQLDQPIDQLSAPASAAKVPAPPIRDPENGPTPHLDTNDLMAIAQMDPAEIAALMEGTVRRKRLEMGAKVAGRVSRVERDTVFVDIGGKSEGQLDRSEVPDVKVGQEVTAYFVGEDEAGISLSLQLSGEAASDHLEEARTSGSPVEGKVTARNSGGFEVRIGSARAFCPVSLISRIPEVDLDAYVGQTLQFRVIETGEKTVVNRRILQEEEAESKAEAVWGTLVVGQQHRGVVRSVQSFGLFVDIGGVDGLVPRREISWKGVDDPRTSVRVGQAVEVVILEIDHERKKLTLSAKALEDDPWSAVDIAFQEGEIYRGIVVRAAEFGLFVELAAGLTGLVHTSKLAAGIPEIGTSIDVRLLAIDRERRRLELAPVRASEGEAAAAAPEVKVRGTVSDVQRNGVVVQLDDGRTGFLPENEVDLPAGTVLSQRFRRGKSIEVRITRDDRSRPQLSMRAAMDEEQRSWRAHQVGDEAKRNAPGGSFGTFGDLLGGLQLRK